ncbi:unnamed protein product [Leptidea sinapis]|uniref:Nuclease HARBI1 n=1 Tax=Leptidea sinapis TaxID=189913 RepID=A0A5E4QY76_9NEOP|nr:unnamed protein product [Leptidea sinapis]
MVFPSSSSESDLELLEFISDISVPRNLRRRRNPFEMFTEQEFKLRYRFDKNTVLHISTFQVVIGDDINVHKTTVSRVVHKVSKEIAKLGRIYISMPNYEYSRDVRPQFFKISGLASTNS